MNVSVLTKYWYAGTSRVAMRANGSVYYLLSDQLDSTSITADGDGHFMSELRYTACPLCSAPREEASLGLDFYGARFYDEDVRKGGPLGRPCGIASDRISSLPIAGPGSGS